MGLVRAIPGVDLVGCTAGNCDGLGWGLAALGVVPSGSNVRLGLTGLAHVAGRHFADGALSAGRSVFNVGEDLYDLAARAHNVAPVQSGPRWIRVVDAGRPVGVDRTTGALTSNYSVVTDRVGNVVTMHPGIAVPRR